MDILEPDAETQRYRVEAIAAFSHEIRTPLTSLKMLIELGRRHGADGEVRLDAEMTQMLVLTVDEIHRMVDEVQESSRLMRGKLRLRDASQSLNSIFEQTAHYLPAGFDLNGSLPSDITGSWDGERLPRAIAGFASAVDRLGRGNGHVETAFEHQPGHIVMTFGSGMPAGVCEPFFNADAGFPFFTARQLVLAMGGSVHCERFDHCARVRVTLPCLVDQE